MPLPPRLILSLEWVYHPASIPCTWGSCPSLSQPNQLKDPAYSFLCNISYCIPTPRGLWSCEVDLLKLQSAKSGAALHRKLPCFFFFVKALIEQAEIRIGLSAIHQILHSSLSKSTPLSILYIPKMTVQAVRSQ